MLTFPSKRLSCLDIHLSIALAHWTSVVSPVSQCAIGQHLMTAHSGKTSHDCHIDSGNNGRENVVKWSCDLNTGCHGLGMTAKVVQVHNSEVTLNSTVTITSKNHLGVMRCEPATKIRLLKSCSLSHFTWRLLVFLFLVILCLLRQRPNGRSVKVTR